MGRDPRSREQVATALATEASRHEMAADRYEQMGDTASAARSRHHAVALRAALDAYQRRIARVQALRAEAGSALPPPTVNSTGLVAALEPPAFPTSSPHLTTAATGPKGAVNRA